MSITRDKRGDDMQRRIGGGQHECREEQINCYCTFTINVIIQSVLNRAGI